MFKSFNAESRLLLQHHHSHHHPHHSLKPQHSHHSPRHYHTNIPKMEPFTYNANPSRVIFGNGTLSQLAAELQRLGFTKPYILSTPEQAADARTIKNILANATPAITAAGICSNATMHTPTSVTDSAIKALGDTNADCIISFGGGSTIGLGKALSFRCGFHHICIPTTYAGSEMTPILGETSDGVKTTRSDPKILPGTVIYDVNNTMKLPPGMTATSGVNAIAHAVEALYATNANPITSLLAAEGISALARALPALAADGSDRAARELALYGAWLCGGCLGSVGMSLHHKLCHTLGGTFNLPHAQTHTIVLPHALAYNLPKLSPAVQKRLADAFPGSDGDAVQGLNKLIGALKVERGLKSYGMKEEDVEKAAEVATSKPYPNPRPVEKEGIREVIRRAWAGEEARADL
ncbi:hypothetical protein EDC01DRAFT_650441 [Geopyxis carbonaria]|nr:hypothetical protein EDC01DRAFT_650441 [Geopyxis carbonaria]